MIRTWHVPRIASQSNLTLKLLAFFLSVFLWGFVKFTQTPFSATISQADVQVPLDVMKEAEMEALDAPDSVRITVRGSDDAIRSLKPNAISATIDLRGASEGLLLPPVHVSQPPDLTVVAVQPERFSIRLVPVITQSFPVESKFSGHVAQGYTASAPILRTATANVTGPRNYVSQVKTVQAMVTLNNTETGIMQRALLEPRDEDGNLVHKVAVSPETEIVTVNVTPAIVPRMLAVFPLLTGSVHRDLTIDTSWTPRILPVVFAYAKPVTAPPSSLFTQAIDISHFSIGEHRFTVSVPPPNGGTLVKDKEIQVTVRVRPARNTAPRRGNDE